MLDKFNLSRRENVFLAKKTLVTSVYNSAKMENVNVTFPETKTILDGVSVSNLDMDDIQIILNLRNAWRYLLNNIDARTDLEFIEKVNSFISYNESLEWGVLRNGNVGITGISYKPTVPVREKIIEQLSEIFKISNVTERAITYMLWAMRKQLFWDGNKRTSILCANKILIENGKGVLTIPEEHLGEFNKRLSQFYETNDYGEINTFIYEKCLFGIEYREETVKHEPNKIISEDIDI